MALDVPKVMSITEERVIFATQLGVALQQWAEVEHALCILTATCFDSEDERRYFNVGFLAIEGFRSKYLFADHAIRRSLSARGQVDKIENWTALAGRLSSHSATRNSLAHWPTRAFMGEAEGHRVACVRLIQKKGQPPDRRPPENSIDLMGVIRARHEFLALVFDLENFMADICRQPRLHTKSVALLENPPTILQIRRRILEELGHPQKSSAEKRREKEAQDAAASLQPPDSEGK